MTRYDTVIHGGTVILPGQEPVRCDVAIRDGHIAALAEGLEAGDAAERSTPRA